MSQAAISPGPFIARLAGLPVSALEPFGSPLCAERAAAWEGVQRDLKAVRGALADRLHEVVCHAAPGLRRFVLGVRRDCHNGRSLRRHSVAPLWQVLREAAGPLADRAVTLENELAAVETALETTFAAERERERLHLLSFLADRPLLRGIALSSPVVAGNLHRLRGASTASQGRKEIRLETTLLRYVSRAAFKTSPYSTLTRIVLGEARDGMAGPPRLLGQDWPERSLLRLKRYLLDQCWCLMLRHVPLRGELTVVRNSSLEETSPGRYRFLRPGFWDLHPESGELRYFLAAIVQGGAGGALPSFLLHAAETGPLYRDLLALARREHGADAGTVQPDLDRLLDLGFLLLLPPWPAQEGHLEKSMLESLRTYPGDPGLRSVAGVLERIVGLEESYPATAEPVRAVMEIERLVDELWAAAALLGGLTPEVKRPRLPTGNFYEDVLLQRSDSPPGQGPEIVAVPRAAMEEVLGHAALLARFNQLFDPGCDFLLTVDDFLAERWPERREVTVLELLAVLQPLWHEYKRFTKSLGGRQPSTTFNPRSLPFLDTLQRVRTDVREGARCCVIPCRTACGTEYRLDSERFVSLLSQIPDLCRPAVGPCLFLQAADAEGTLWVLNRIHEGTGRYGSRYTPVMDDEMRRSYAAYFTARAADGGGRELLDLACPQGDTLNVHAPQTPRVLEMPGETAGVPPARRVTLRELRIRRADEEGGLPSVVDDRGRELLPVHLGGAASKFLPTPLKILSLFGPGEVRARVPGLPERREGDAAVLDRLTLGNLVVSRRRWSFSPNPMAGRLDGLSDAAAFAAVDRWRREQGLPDRVVLIEKVHHERKDDFYKPQYLDFTSPLFSAVFRSALRENAASLTFEEILPSSEAAPRDGRGDRWALELMLDSLALRAALDPISRPPVPAPGGVVQHEPAMAH